MDPLNIFVAACNLILTLPILVGNMLIILVFALYVSTEWKHPHIFIVNMAVSDFIVGLFLPLDAAFYIDNPLRYDKYVCFFRFTIFVGALGQSIASLTAISIDRFIAIFFPLKYELYVTRTRVIVFLIMGWTIIIGLCLMPFFGKYHSILQTQ